MSQTPTAPIHDAVLAAALLGIQYTAEDLAAFGAPPPPAPGSLTFFDPGWSILRLRDAVANKGTIFYQQSWYDTQDFATMEEQSRYRQLRVEAVEGSFSKTFADQQGLLPSDEEVPPARVVIMGMVLHFLATGQRLFPGYWVRCQDQSSDGYRVWVGHFHRSGLGVFRDPDENRSADLGLAAARNF
jgi:hypothetical protein